MTNRKIGIGRRLAAAGLSLVICGVCTFHQQLWAGELSPVVNAEMTEFGTKTLILGTSTEEFDSFGEADVVQVETGIYALSYTTQEEAEAAYKEFQQQEFIEFVEPDAVMTVEDATLEPDGGTTDESVKTKKKAKAERAGDESSILLAVVDTGIQADAGSAGAYLLEGEETSDENGHGTKIANLIADTFVREGMTRQEIQLLPVKVANEDGRCSVLQLYLGIRAAMEWDADIINISMGTKNRQESELLGRIMEEAEEAGILIVTSAGNDGSDVAAYSPANIASVLTVGAVDSKKRQAAFSNYGRTMDCVSYGTGIVVTGADGKTAEEDGTSYAAALVAAELAVRMAQGELHTPKEAEAYIKKNAEDLGETGWDESYGYGLIGSYAYPDTDTTDTEIEDTETRAEDIQAGCGEAFVRKAELLNLLIGDIILLAGNENYESTELLAGTMKKSADELFAMKEDIADALSGVSAESGILIKSYMASGNTDIDEHAGALVDYLKQAAAGVDDRRENRDKFLQKLDAFVQFLSGYQESTPLAESVSIEASTTKTVSDAATLQSIAQTAGDYTVKLTKNITLKSEIVVTNGCTLRIQSDEKNTRRTIKFGTLPDEAKYYAGGGMCMFQVKGTKANKLYLGTESGDYPVTLDGNKEAHNGFLIYNSQWSYDTDSYKSVVHIYAGTILKNNVMYYDPSDYGNGASGSAICNYGTLYLHGGIIQNNGFLGKGGAKVGEGGAIANYHKFYMTGGEIRDNAATNGNAILTAKISGVSHLSDFEMKITGGSIHDNGFSENLTYTSNGGGILINPDTPVTIGGSSTGSVKIYGNYAQYGGGITNHGKLTLGKCSIYENYCESEGGGIINQAKKTSSQGGGQVTIDAAVPTLDIDGAYVYQNYCMKTGSSYAGGIASLKNTVDNKTVVPKLTIGTGYFYDNDGYSIHIDSGTLSIGKGARFGFSAYTDTETYKVKADWTGSGISNTGGTVNITGAARMFVPEGATGIKNTGTLNIEDGAGFLMFCKDAECGIANTGKIKCGKIAVNASGTVLYPYSIDGAAEYGIKNTGSGTAYLTGRIRGNYTVTRTARKEGGTKGNITTGIYNTSTASYSDGNPYAVILTGTTIDGTDYTGLVNYAGTGISNNTAAGSIAIKQGKVANSAEHGISNKGTLLVADADASITGNEGDGIYNAASGNLTVSAAAKIHDNKSNGITNKGTASMSAGTIRGNSKYGVDQNGTFYMSGPAQVNVNNTVYLREGRVITVNGALTTNGVVAKIEPKNTEVGTKVVTTTYAGSKGSNALFYNTTGYRFTLSDGGILRPGDYMDREVLAKEKHTEISDKDIVISKKYTVTYYKNISETMAVANLPEKQTKYWCENLSIPNAQPHVTTEPYASYYRFAHWSEVSEKGAAAVLLPMVYKENQAYALYAQWQQIFNVAYIGNGQSAGENFIESGVSGDSMYTFNGNRNADGSEHFTKKIVHSYTDEETGKEVKQETTATVVRWSFDKGDTLKDHVQRGYYLRQDISVDVLFEHARTIKEAITYGAPNTDYSLFLGSAGTLINSVSGQPYLNIYAIWDEGPMIEAYDLYYTLEEAQGTTDTQGITVEELLSRANVTDKEDGTLPHGTNIAYGNGKNTTFTVSDYAAEDFSSFTSEGSVTVNYQAVDTAGNVTNKRVTVHIVDTGAKDIDKGRIRFISGKYLDTLSEESIWRVDSEYYNELLLVLQNHREDVESVNEQMFGETVTIEKPGSGTWEAEPEQIWVFTNEQVEAVKTYIENHGMGNSKNEAALNGFLKEFAGCRQ